jgi:hypothetical protein
MTTTKLEKLLRDSYLESGARRSAKLLETKMYVSSIPQEKFLHEIQQISNNKLLNLLLNVGLNAKTQTVFLQQFKKNSDEEEAK